MRSFIYLLCSLTMFYFNPVLVISQSWQQIITVEDLYTAYPQQVHKIFHSIDLDQKGLEKVKALYTEDKIQEACTTLLDYYRTGESGAHLRRTLPATSTAVLSSIDTILRNVFVIQNVRGQVPWKEDGHRDWHYKGPNNDREWAWLSNRHSQLNKVLEAYFQTGNPKYVDYIDSFLRDFIIASWPYPAVKSSTSVWRGLEVAARVKIWTKIFYNLQESPRFSPATRLLILSSLPDHAHYNRNFHGQNNWLTMEISALSTIAADFPEYRSSKEWLDYSASTMIQSMEGQVYPDGTQTELSAHYHTVAMRNFELFQEICDRAQYDLPEFFRQTIEKMYGYTAHTVRPDGHGILNNDGDRFDCEPLIRRGASHYGHPEWNYIISNGAEGKRPSGEPSYFYPWAGQLISRSGYDADAHWSFFDVGPWGSGHQHNDKLHLSIAAYGRDLLVDAGRFAYTGTVAEKFRSYAKGSSGHNVILIDGKGQAPGPRITDKPILKDQWEITEEFDWACSSMVDFIDVAGEIEHRRGLYYDRGNYWVVVDKISTDRPRNIEVLWHWHPDCTVALEGNRSFSQNPRGNLQIVPAGGPDWEIKIIEGQEEPEIQGWYSEEYNKFSPNKAVIYSGSLPESTVFVWLMHPTEGAKIKADIELISVAEHEVTVRIHIGDQDEKLIKIPI